MDLWSTCLLKTDVIGVLINFSHFFSIYMRVFRVREILNDS